MAPNYSRNRLARLTTHPGQFEPDWANGRFRRTGVTQFPSRSPLWPTVPAHRRKALGLHLAYSGGGNAARAEIAGDGEPRVSAAKDPASTTLCLSSGHAEHLLSPPPRFHRTYPPLASASPSSLQRNVRPRGSSGFLRSSTTAIGSPRSLDCTGGLKLISRNGNDRTPLFRAPFDGLLSAGRELSAHPAPPGPWPPGWYRQRHNSEFRLISAPAAPSLSRGRPRRGILLRWWRQRFAHWLRLDLGAHRLQHADARGELKPVTVDDLIQLLKERFGLFVGQVKGHAREVEALTSGRESGPLFPVDRDHRCCWPRRLRR